MAKDKRALDDLDAELAALEAELAALEGKKAAPRPKKAKPAPREEAPAAAPEPAAEKPAKRRLALPSLKKAKGEEPPAAPAPAQAAASAEPAPEAPRKKVALPFGRKKSADAAEPAAEAAPQEPTPTRAPVPASTPAKLAQAPAFARTYDPSLWRHEEGAWVRAVPEAKPIVVRRVLDERDVVVREEPATPEDVDEVTGAKAERGLGKLLGGRSLKLPRLGRKGE